jgi:hypothetical protein
MTGYFVSLFMGLAVGVAYGFVSAVTRQPWSLPPQEL